MIRVFHRRRNDDRTPRPNARRPTVEGLEDRLLLYGDPVGQWPYPIRVTYSFMPDGTNMAGSPSALYSTLNSVMPTATWQADLAKAAAAWNMAANVNLVHVTDDGEPMGAGPLLQGNPNFGDIRIGAMPESDNVLADTFLPPPMNGSSAAGDIMFNSNATWGPNGYDLTTVAFHEFGHALGLDHSTITSAVMYADYNGAKLGLTSDDVAAIQDVYGARVAAADSTSATATPVTLNSQDYSVMSGLQIASASNANWYSVVVPSDTNGALTVIVQSNQLSSLEPRLAMYNSALHGLALVYGTTFGDTIGLQIANVSPGQTYYIRVTANVTGPGSAGAYALTVNAGSNTPTPVPIPQTSVVTSSYGGNTTEPETADGFTSVGKLHPHHGASVRGVHGLGPSFLMKVRTLRRESVHH